VELNSSVHLFADDCTIFREITCKKDCDGLQADLKRLYYWTQQWQLTLNQSKCKAMRITNKLKKIDYTYSLNGVPLEWVNTFRYLGVRINGKLTWTDHVSEVKTKATRMLNLLRRSMQGEFAASIPVGPKFSRNLVFPLWPSLLAVNEVDSHYVSTWVCLSQGCATG